MQSLLAIQIRWQSHATGKKRGFSFVYKVRKQLHFPLEEDCHERR
jgi:hypothetical protein